MPDEIGAYRGKDKALYYNTGTRATPTWVKLDARDKTLPITWDEADVSSDSSDFKLMLKALAEVGIDWQMVYYNGDSDFVAMWQAALSPTAVYEFALMSGPIATVGSRGVRFFGQVMSATDNAALSDGQLVDFNVKPTRYYESDTLVPPVELVTSS